MVFSEVVVSFSVVSSVVSEVEVSSMGMAVTSDLVVSDSVVVRLGSGSFEISGSFLCMQDVNRVTAAVIAAIAASILLRNVNQSFFNGLAYGLLIRK